MRKTFIAASLFIAAVALTIAPLAADAHRSGCHRWHTCPSDTGSYTMGSPPPSQSPSKPVEPQTKAAGEPAYKAPNPNDQISEIYFSPGGGAEAAVVRVIDSAQRVIDVAMYSLTSSDIGRALVQAKSRGVRVRVYLDKAQKTDTYSKSRFLAQNGLSVRYDTYSGLMHHKFAIIDGTMVLTGSFNWTASAEERNAENLLVIKDAGVSRAYEDLFETTWIEHSE